MTNYITQAGDQWDMIAKKVYGDETKADILMSANLRYLDTFEFDYGTSLICPDIPDSSGSSLPPWRQ